MYKMAKIIGMPQIEIDFYYAGLTAMTRGEKGQMILVVKETGEGELVHKFKDLRDFTDEVKETFSEQNQRYIKESLDQHPKELFVIRYNESASGIEEDSEGEVFEYLSTLEEVFKMVNATASRNCWITIADQTKEDSKALIDFIKTENKFNKKRYKALVYQALEPDHMHIVNFTTDRFKLKEGSGTRNGLELVPRVTAALAGQPLSYSIIAKVFKDIEYVTQPDDMDAAVDKGELFLFSDEGEVRVGRGVNSLTTLEPDMSDDMKFIIIVEQMDLIYADIYATWNRSYKGWYKNNLDNQMLLISALKAYLYALEQEEILDISYENNVTIDANAQKLANIPIYGVDEVESWSKDKILEMTVGTNVYVEMDIKMLNAMEDIQVSIFF